MSIKQSLDRGLFQWISYSHGNFEANHITSHAHTHSLSLFLSLYIYGEMGDELLDGKMRLSNDLPHSYTCTRHSTIPGFYVVLVLCCKRSYSLPKFKK